MDSYMKKLLMFFLSAVLSANIALATVFASDEFQLPPELSDYVVGKVYNDVNFDDGTVGNLELPVAGGAIGQIENGKYIFINNSGSISRLVTASAENDGPGVYVLEFNAMYTSDDASSSFKASRKINTKYNGSIQSLLYFDGGFASGAKLKLFDKYVSNASGEQLFIDGTASHSYRIIIDTINGKTWLYLDDNLVAEDSSAINKNSLIGVTQFHSGTLSGGVPSKDIFDDIKFYKMIMPGLNGIKRDGNDDVVPAGTKVFFSLDAALSSEMEVSYYVNGVNCGKVDGDSFGVTVGGGINTVYVQIDGTDIVSNTITVNAIDYIEDRVYYDVNFDDGSLQGSNGAALTAELTDGASAEFAGGAYIVKNSGTKFPSLKTASLESNGAGVYVWEFDACFDSLNDDKKFDAERYMRVRYNNDAYKLIGWDYLNDYARIMLFHGQVNTGLKIYPGEKHSYKVILDTVNGRAWFYLDDRLIKSDFTRLNVGSSIGKTEFFFGNKANVVDTIDNIKIRRLKSNATAVVLCNESGNVDYDDAKISILFSEKMSTANICSENVILTDENNNLIEIDEPVYIADTNVLEITPLRHLFPNSSYKIKLNNQKTATGGVLSGDSEFYFKTEKSPVCVDEIVLSNCSNINDCIGKTISAKVKFRNKTDNPEKAVLFIGLFNEYSLLDYDIQVVDIENGSSTFSPISLNVPAVKDDYAIKACLVSDVDLLDMDIFDVYLLK